MKEKKYFSLPVTFTEIKSNYSFDDSLIPVDIKVMHNGLNLNKSTFFDDAINDAQESLKNKPLLGYIRKVDGTDDKDFAGHEVEITFGEEGVKLVYLERPLGTIPETNNYAIQEKEGKKFVSCRGFLWKEHLNDGYEVLKNNPNKSVSMEIVVDDYDINEDGTINIKKYRYLGVTILGDNTAPAMTGAELNVVGQFSEKFSQDFYSKLEDLNTKLQTFSNNQKQVEGGEVVAEKNEQKDFTEEVVETKEEEEVKENIMFELSHDDIRGKIFDILNPKDEEGYRNWNYWIMEVFETYVIVADENESDTYWRFNYSIDENDEIQLGEKVQIFMIWATQEQKDLLEQEKQEFESLKQSHSELTTEVDKLREFKAIKDQEEYQVQLEKDRQDKIDYINTEFSNIPESVRSEFISKVDEYETKEDIESDICVYVVKNKVKFSKKKEESKNIKIEIETKQTELKMSPYGDLFNK